MRREYQYSEDGGRWGVPHACNYRSILNAIASLIEAQRPDLVMVLIEQEPDSENWPLQPTSNGSVVYDPLQPR